MIKTKISCFKSVSSLLANPNKCQLITIDQITVYCRTVCTYNSNFQIQNKIRQDDAVVRVKKMMRINLINSLINKNLLLLNKHRMILGSNVNCYAYFNTSTLFNQSINNELTKILTKAEKVVGYPTSFLNLRYLLSDEVANFANLLRKIMQTKHPLVKLAKNLIGSSSDSNDSKRSLQINGLIILLISKAAGRPKNFTSLQSDISDGIHVSQRCLAEISEMIYMAFLIHKGVLDLKLVSQNEYKDMDQGNKLAVLCGDYLLSTACTNLAKLQNTRVVELMSQVICDASESIFESNSKSKTNTFLTLWYDNVNSNTSSLLANSAKSAMLLVKHSPRMQEVAWSFAKNFDITHKIWTELVEYKKDATLLNKSKTLLNAIYVDKYKYPKKDDKNNLGNSSSTSASSNETSASSTPPTSSATGSHLKSKSSKLLAAFYSTVTTTSRVTSDATNQAAQIHPVIVDHVLNDCKVLLDNHYEMAMQCLTQLENENSEMEAMTSLKSILNVMKSTV